MQRELSQSAGVRDLSALQLKRSIYVARQDVRAKVEPDGSASWVYGATAGKLLFGRETTEVFKMQAGVRIPMRPQELVVRASPTTVTHIHRSGEKVQVSLSLRVVAGESKGWERTVRLANRGESAVKLRVITLHDPTSLNYRRERDPPGDIGVDAFNRHEQVVMDDVGDTTGVRVISVAPRPSLIYMAKDRARASELLSQGDLPGNSLGMSGPVIVLVQHDLELGPGEAVEVRSLSLYHPSSLEPLLGAAGQGPGDAGDGSVSFASSSPSVNHAFEWAKAALYSIEGEQNLTEKLWCGPALALSRPGYFSELAGSMKGLLMKDGTLEYAETRPQKENAPRPGPVETSLYLIALCAYLSARARDRKALKSWFPLVKKVADGLAKMASGGLLVTPTGSPDGWRRRLGAACPTGQVTEVNLMAVRALQDASSVAFLARKSAEATRYKELSESLTKSILERLRDPDTGLLVLNIDRRAIAHKILTADLAAGLSYFSPDASLSASVARRLLEKDFDTGYGPRTVPASNVLYFSPTYADGQLGGYWTRAALAHALLAFSAGLSTTGSAQLEKIARLVDLDAERLGGIPGEFPYWLDTERRQVMGPGSDPVAASRFLEGVLVGEAGLSLAVGGPRFNVPSSSELKWIMLHGLELGRKVSLFVGRARERSFVFTDLDQDAGDGPASALVGLAECQRLVTPPGVEGLLFWDAASSIVCLGNTLNAPVTGQVTVPARSKSFLSSLFATLEELRPETGEWAQVDKVKLNKAVELRVELKQGAWKALRLARA